MTYLKLTLRVSGDLQEFLIAELLDLDFEGFEQFDDSLEAYIPKERFGDYAREYIEQMLASIPGDNYIVTEEIEEQNWNSEWEKTIEPQLIGQFLVRPTWSAHQAPSGKILIEIDPKMSFGTGYHATTRLMLEKFSEVDFEGKRVLDAGTGTGILAIAAAKKGSTRVLAFDIDPWSERNARENILINDAGSRVEVMTGGFEIIPEGETFDLILANINRNVISAHLPVMKNHLSPDGDILVTGILKSDTAQILEKAASVTLNHAETVFLEEWTLLHFTSSRNS